MNYRSYALGLLLSNDSSAAAVVGRDSPISSDDSLITVSRAEWVGLHLEVARLQQLLDVTPSATAGTRTRRNQPHTRSMQGEQR